jgi:hypothetical protein
MIWSIQSFCSFKLFAICFDLMEEYNYWCITNFTYNDPSGGSVKVFTKQRRVGKATFTDPSSDANTQPWCSVLEMKWPLITPSNIQKMNDSSGTWININLNEYHIKNKNNHSCGQPEHMDWCTMHGSATSTHLLCHRN